MRPLAAIDVVVVTGISHIIVVHIDIDVAAMPTAIVSPAITPAGA
jgi:hypothetical protein